MTIHENAVLVRLNIAQWTARRYDKNASKEVAQAHGAKDAGRFNKVLIGREHLEPIEQLAGTLRTKHYQLTLPWQDDGTRLLPTALFMAYSEAMSEIQTKFSDAVTQFVNEYPKLVNDARQRLGTLYRPEDYPVTVAERFGVQIEYTPVPSTDDFRVVASKDAAQMIRDEVTKSVSATLELRQKEALKECWARVQDTVSRVQERCASAKPVIRESLMESVQELIDLLPALNITQDPELTKIHSELHKLLESPTRLRSNAGARSRVAQEAQALLDKMNF